MINRGNRIFILFHLYSCKIANLACFVTFNSILIHDIIQASCIFHLYTVYMIGLPRLWDTVSMNLAQKKHVLPQKFVI